MKANEDNYLLYLHKMQESRVETALNESRFANVAVAQHAAVPALPACLADPGDAALAHHRLHDQRRLRIHRRTTE